MDHASIGKSWVSEVWSHYTKQKVNKIQTAPEISSHVRQFVLLVILSLLEFFNFLKLNELKCEEQ